MRETTEEREARWKLIRQLDVMALICFATAAALPAIGIIVIMVRAALAGEFFGCK